MQVLLHCPPNWSGGRRSSERPTKVPDTRYTVPGSVCEDLLVFTIMYLYILEMSCATFILRYSSDTVLSWIVLILILYTRYLVLSIVQLESTR